MRKYPDMNCRVHFFFVPSYFVARFLSSLCRRSKKSWNLYDCVNIFESVRCNGINRLGMFYLKVTLVDNQNRINDFNVFKVRSVALIVERCILWYFTWLILLWFIYIRITFKCNGTQKLTKSIEYHHVFTCRIHNLASPFDPI